MRAVDLEVVDRWLAVGEQQVRTELSRGGSMERVAILTGSKKILESLKQDIRGPKFAAPTTLVKEKSASPSLTFMAPLDGEKLTEHLARVKEEAAQRGLGDVVGFVLSLEYYLASGAFDQTPKPKRTKVYSVPRRTPDNDLASALNSIASAQARTKYQAIVEALKQGPATDDELRKRLRGVIDVAPGTVTAYRGDLARAGWVRFAGQHQPGDSGSSMKVWELAP